MLTSGDIVELELGAPSGSEAGLRRPAVVVTARQILQGNPNIIHVVPLTRTVRESMTEVIIEPDPFNGLEVLSTVQCQHIRAVATSRAHHLLGNVGAATLHRIREVIRTIIDA